MLFLLIVVLLGILVSILDIILWRQRWIHIVNIVIQIGSWILGLAAIVVAGVWGTLYFPVPILGTLLLWIAHRRRQKKRAGS